MDIRPSSSFNPTYPPTQEPKTAAPPTPGSTAATANPHAAPDSETNDALYEAVALATTAPALPKSAAGTTASSASTNLQTAHTVARGNPARDAERRLPDVIDTLFTGARDAIAGAGRNIAEAVEGFFRGFASFFSGKSEAGLKQMGGAVLRLAQTPVDATLLLAGSVTSAAQTLLGLEPTARKLSDSEITTLRQTFGDSIDFDRVRIKEGNAGVLTLSGRAFTLGNTIFSKEPLTPDVLAHEMTHVWQHQSGGDDYLSEALLAQAEAAVGTGPGYAWEQESVHTPWSQLSPEQQGQFIQDATEAGAFENDPPRFASLPSDYPGTLNDLNRYLDQALAEIKQGHGAA